MEVGESQNPPHEEVVAGVRLQVVVVVGDPGVVVVITAENGRNDRNGVRTVGRHTLLPVTPRVGAAITANQATSYLPEVESQPVVGRESIPREEGADTVVRHRKLADRQYLVVSHTMGSTQQPLVPLVEMTIHLV